MATKVQEQISRLLDDAVDVYTANTARRTDDTIARACQHDRRSIGILRHTRGDDPYDPFVPVRLVKDYDGLMRQLRVDL
ncbi:Uncharacterised protein [Chlamydia trachomatis]|nr:Uncharacterised protein [Chlamydia trachomatis]